MDGDAVIICRAQKAKVNLLVEPNPKMLSDWKFCSDHQKSESNEMADDDYYYDYDGVLF